MADLFQSLTTAPDDFVAIVADVLERRAADPAQQAILADYAGALPLPAAAKVLEIGCGTGPVARYFAGLDWVAAVRGIDPAPGLIARARKLGDGIPRLEFAVAAGEDTGEATASYDVVVLHTVLSHVAEPAAVLAEAQRVLKPGGWLAVCDADFSKASVALGSGDPLQACVEAWAEEAVTHHWLVPQLPAMLTAAGFRVERFRGHHPVDIEGIASGPAWIDFGIDVLLGRGSIGAALAEALRQEARRRIADGRFFAALPFASMLATSR